jgi:PAS domain S-box-containing protein
MTTPHALDRHPRLDMLARATGMLVALAGALGLVGHLLGASMLLRPLGLGPSPSVAACVCLLALGLSTVGMLGGCAPRAVAAGLGLILSVYVGWALYRAVSGVIAGRGIAGDRGELDMSSAASLAAQVATVAFFALRPATRAPIAIASTLTLGLSLVSLLAHSIAVPILQRYGAEMPFLLALSLALHGSGMLAWAWKSDVRKDEAPMPTWSPLVAAISAGVLFLGFAVAVEGDSALLQLALVIGAAAKLGSAVHQRLREQRVEAAARRVAHAAQVRAEETSAEALARRRWIERILDLAPVPLALIDPTPDAASGARVTFANEAARALAGGPWNNGEGAMTYTDRLGRPLPERDAPPARVARGERLDGSEVVAMTPAGRRDLLVHGALLPSTQGQAPIAVLALQDITRLRRAEAATMRLGRLLDDAHTEVYVIDATSLRFRQANAGALRDLGYRSEELRDMTALSILPELTQETLDVLLEPLRTGERDQVTIETMHARRDGSHYPVEARIQLSRAEAPPVFVALVENITTRKRIEAERAQLLALERHAREEADAERERFAFVAEASRALADPVDLEGTVRATARTAVPRLARWSAVCLAAEDGSVHRAAVSAPDDPGGLSASIARDPPVLLEGMPLDRAIRHGETVVTPTIDGPQYRESLALSTEEAIEAARALGMAGTVTLPLRARGRTLGALTLVETSAPSHWTSGAELALAHDYAARAALAIDDAQLHEEAKAALRARDEFLLVASQDLRMPLSLLRMNIEGMIRQVGRAGAGPIPDGRLARLLDSSLRLTSKLSFVIEDLMDPSRVTSERLPLSIERVDLAGLVCTVVARFDQDLERAGCRVVLSAPEAIEGDWDRFRLEQVVANFLSNAIKFGAGQPIEVSVEADDTMARLRVRDHGVGMTQDRQTSIFSLAERTASTRHYGGVGLGLYLVRRIVETLGGTIEVETWPGAGALFVVTLPRHRDAGHNQESAA